MSDLDSATRTSQNQRPDLTALTWCLEEIRHSMGRVVTQIQEAQDNPDSAVAERLRVASAAAHQVIGALRFLQLDAVARIPEQIERVLEAIAQGDCTLDAATVRTIEQACDALVHWLSIAARGASVSPMDLFASYQSLMKLRGFDRIEPSDLIEIRLLEGAPESLTLQPLSSTHAAAVQGAFERGLLGFLRNAQDVSALRAMQAGLQRMVRVPAPSMHRDTWWLACAFIDALQNASLQADLAAKRLVARLAHQLRKSLRSVRDASDVSTQAFHDADKRSPDSSDDRSHASLQRELLFLIACSGPGSELADAVRRKNRLDDLIRPASREPGLALAEPRTLARAIETIGQAKTAWEAVASGGGAAWDLFGAALQRLDATLAALPFNGLQELSAGLLRVRRRLSGIEGPPAEPVAIELAACLLFVEMALQGGQEPGEARNAQASEMKARLDLLPDQASLLGPLPQWLCELGQKTQDAATRGSLVDALVVNLRHAEQLLDTFFRDPVQREALNGSREPLLQVEAALRLLGHIDAAAGLRTIVQGIIDFVESTEPPGSDTLTWVAAELGSIGFFVESLRQLDSVASGFEFQFRAGHFVAALKTPEGPQALALVPEGSSQSGAPGADTELIAVFLAEATEVLERLQEQLHRLEEAPRDLQALTSARRCVHTLKGSSRMVGLDEMASLAWICEQALTDWIAQEQACSPRQRQRLADWARQCLLWVEALRLDPAHRIDPADWADQLKDLRADPGGVQGEPRADAALVKLFLDEADQILVTLDTAGQAMRLHPEEPVSEQAVRAAHSLAGNARLVTLEAVGYGAQALEHCFEAQRRCLLAWQSSDLETFGLILDGLRAALHRFAATRDLQDDFALRERARAWREHWQAQASPLPGPDVQSDGEGQSEEAPIQGFLQSPPGTPPAPWADELDHDLLPVFLEEARSLMPQVDEALHLWKSAPEQRRWVPLLMRWLHTLKGSARMAGAMRLGQAIHDMESLLEPHAERSDAASSDGGAALVSLIDQLTACQDDATDLLEHLTSLHSPAVPALQAGFAPEGASGDRPPIKGPQPAENLSGWPQAAAIAQAGAQSIQTLESAEPASTVIQPMIRVRADLLDRLVNEAGEVAIARARLDGELTGVHGALSDLSDNVARLRNQLREIQVAADSRISVRRGQALAGPDFDPLELDHYTRFQELTRLLAESVEDVATVHQNALRGLEQASRDLHLQAQVTRDLQHDLMSIRRVRFGSMGERLHRVVRQAARDMARPAHLKIEGDRAELDRAVLERIVGPLEHLLRNALAHGIEPTPVRVQAGKPVQGQLRLSVRAEGRSVAIDLADDGSGLDFLRIRDRAIERGLIDADAQLTEAELAQLIFLPGFTTAEQVSAIAGRGVGLDVVRAEVAAMGGRIEVQSMAGQGASFCLHLPASMAMSQVVLVRAATQQFAISASLIEQVLQPDAEALNRAHAARRLTLQDGSVLPLIYLGRLLELPGDPLGQRLAPVAILRSGHQRLAVHVDEIHAAQEVVVKDVGAMISRMPGFVGATVLGHGEIILIIDPVQIEAAARRSGAGEASPAIVQPAHMVLAPTVMVVDDSVTVRKVTQRLLQREGYTVMLARDGLDALQMLEEAVPDILLLDIEMPRMDGFELMSRLRAQPRLADIPVVMISSRTADKHREHAARLGVQAFLGKPYDETELLELIGRFTTS